MKYQKLITSVTIIFILMLLVASCGSKEVESVVQESTKETVEEESVESEVLGFDELDGMGDVGVDKGLFNVVITIPADFVGEEINQEELDQEAMEKGYKSIILNDDGSASYTMTKMQHNEMMDEMKTSLDASLQEMIDSEDHPNILSIESSNNYTEFLIVTKNEEPDMSESLQVFALYMYAGIYNIFNGTEVNNINIKFVNDISGEIILESNSSDMNE